jgi:peptidoglycan/xylan/chitin deacetylase (PgdA/CDA1 family)
VPVLAYHQVTDTVLPPLAGRFAVRVAQFEEQMHYLHTQGYRCLSLSDLLRLHAAGAPIAERSFVVTFDDGFHDFYTEAFPILGRCGFTATVFLVTNCIGGASDWDGERGYPLLTWEQVGDLHRQGITFGSHTCTHPRLVHMTPNAVWREITASKATLEHRLGDAVYWLAYPYGQSTRLIREQAASAGYHAACGVNTGSGGLFNLWRTECLAQDTLSAFAFKLSRRYCCFQHFWRWFREDTVAGRSLRNLKHRWINRSPSS